MAHNFMRKLEQVPRPIIFALLKVIAGIMILVVAHSIGTYVKLRLIKLNEQRQSETVALLAIAKLAYFSILVIASLLILRLLGVEIASIIAILSATAFVLGMSLQGTLSDIASGFMLALFQTYNIGDIIGIHGVNDGGGLLTGKVIEFRLVNTIIEDSYSKVRVTVPNRKIQESIVLNYSSTKVHMVAIDILASNTNKNFKDITDAIMKDLKDTAKYPDLDLKHKISARAFVYDMSEVGTKIRVTCPIESTDIAQRKARISTAIRQLLSDMNVTLVDPF